MLTLRSRPEAIRRDITWVHRDGLRLALHRWGPRQPRAAVFYFHGLQSHAGWLWEAGVRHAEHGIAFYVLDRRGCGISDGERGAIPDADTVLGDYVAALAQVRDAIGERLPLGLFGHCLGGSFLAALLLHHPARTVRHDSVVFCSAPLGRLHATLNEAQRDALSRYRDDEVWAPGLRSEDFSACARYQEFIDGDDLAVRTLTRRSRAVLLDLERIYLGREGGPRVHVPAAYVSGHRDPVVDLEHSRSVFRGLVGESGRCVQFATDKHYVYFTEVRDDLIAWSSSFVAGAEGAGHA
ncbi:alpha/beta hydrolase [Streptomyces sioyaensis]|uniref:alpha/beta hydrolase n=1 Tax=Streptomyces sioyaensis TaxID=67364 RepID=UPI0037D249BB